MARPIKTEVMRVWTSDTELLYRLEQLVQLTLRTDTIQTLLCVPDDCRNILRTHIKAFAEKHGIHYLAPRGKIRLAYDYSAVERTALSVMLTMMESVPDSGIDTNANGTLISTPVLDRLIAVYTTYLQMIQSDAGSAPVTFEIFTRAWQALRQGRAIAQVCYSCGGTHYMFVDAPTVQCPICTTLPIGVMSTHTRRDDAKTRIAVAA